MDGNRSTSVYVGRKYQEGYGVGSVLKSVLKFLIPIFKPAVKNFVLPTAGAVASDVIEKSLVGEENFKEVIKQSAKKRGKKLAKNLLREAGRQIRKRILPNQSGDGMRYPVSSSLQIPRVKTSSNRKKNYKKRSRSKKRSSTKGRKRSRKTKLPRTRKLGIIRKTNRNKKIRFALPNLD